MVSIKPVYIKNCDIEIFINDDGDSCEITFDSFGDSMSFSLDLGVHDLRMLGEAILQIIEERKKVEDNTNNS